MLLSPEHELGSIHLAVLLVAVERLTRHQHEVVLGEAIGVVESQLV
jgi:hypothetical protein